MIRNDSVMMTNSVGTSVAIRRIAKRTIDGASLQCGERAAVYSDGLAKTG
jgi:hypothetical protein